MKIKKVMSCLLAAALLVACQPTPEEEPVVNKGDGALEEAIAAEALPPARYEAPETLRLDPFGTETFQVVVDAEVCVPDVERYPIVEVVLRTVTADWARDMMYKMADGKTIHTYQNEVPTTKEQIEGEITLLQQQLANPDAYLPAGADEQTRAAAEKEWRELLEAWETLYQEAPDTFEPREVDMSDAAFRTVPEFRGAVDFGKQRETYLSVTGGAWGIVEFNNLDDGVGLPFNFDMDSDLTDLNDVTISAEEAVQIGLDYLAQLGETDFAPALIVAGYCEPRGSERPHPTGGMAAVLPDPVHAQRRGRARHLPGGALRRDRLGREGALCARLSAGIHRDGYPRFGRELHVLEHAERAGAHAQRERDADAV